MSDERKRIPHTDFVMDRECRVFRFVEASGSPIGYCRRPSIKGKVIYYQLPYSNVSQSGKSKTVSKPLTRLYRELFGEELVVHSWKRFFLQLREHAATSNINLRERLAVQTKIPAPTQPKRAPTEQYHYRLGSVFNSLKDMDDYAAAVGKPLHGREHLNMANYCPL